MMNDNCIIFVTYEYPYGLSETFIETEIHHLSKCFSQIKIIPSRIFFSRAFYKSSRIATHRSLPPNCEVIKPTSDNFFTYLLSFISFIKIIKYIRIKLRSGFKISTATKEIFAETLKAAFFYSRIKFFLAESKPLIVYSYWKNPAVIALCLYKLQKKSTTPMVTRCHGGDLYYDLPDLPLRPYDQFVSLILDCIIPISQLGAKHLISHGFNSDKIKVSRLGVALPNILTNNSQDGIWRIVSCSNIISTKRVPLIALALSKIEHPFIWTHFGDGIDKNKVLEIVKDFPSHGKAFLPGRLTNKEVIDFYKTEPVDLFINISTSEGVPVSIMEALSSGIPCVATDAGGTSEIVDSNVGLLLPIKLNEQMLARAIYQALSDPATQNKKRLLARERAELLCSSKYNYNLFINLLREISINTNSDQQRA